MNVTSEDLDIARAAVQAMPPMTNDALDRVAASWRAFDDRMRRERARDRRAPTECAILDSAGSSD